MAEAAQQTDGEINGAGGKFDLEQLIENFERLIFEAAQGDLTKYDAISRQPGDLFFKWVAWQRQEKRQRLEFEAVLHGGKISHSSHERDEVETAPAKREAWGALAKKFGGKIGVKRIRRKRN